MEKPVEQMEPMEMAQEIMRLRQLTTIVESQQMQIQTLIQLLAQLGVIVVFSGPDDDTPQEFPA